jgi:mannosylglycerate hydrolase
MASPSTASRCGWSRATTRTGSGSCRLHLAPADASPDHVDDERTITIGDRSVTAADDGSLTVKIGERRWERLATVEDLADSGDTYDFDGLPDDHPITRPARVDVTRRLAPTGVAELTVTRTFDLPVGLTADRRARADATVECVLVTTVRMVPGVPRVDLTVKLDNAARDHRLRLLFPTGAPVDTFRAATTFDTATRTTELADDRGWQHRAPATFPHQGWIAAAGLTVGAPGLPEGEVTTDGTIAVTLLRAVGNLSRFDLRSRPVPAGPGHATPEAQCLGPMTTALALFAGDGDPAVIRSAELGLRAVPAGAQPLLPEGSPLFELEGVAVLSALKPAEAGDGFVVRLLNPADVAGPATLRFGLPVDRFLDARLDETPVSEVPLPAPEGVLTVDVGPHQLRTILVVLQT